MRTRLTDLIGIQHPIIQGAMSWVSFPPLVAAVSNAGGLGILGAAFMTPVQLLDNIKQIRNLTDKPFGVNFMANNKLIDQLLDVIIEQKVRVVSYGVGNPQRVIQRTKPEGILNIPTVGAVKHAVKAQKDGADAVIVQGTEAGGHTGHVASMVLTPIVTQALDIPVAAAGGIADGRGLVAALALGAEGVSMGSRFVVTKESPVPDEVKQYLMQKSEADTVVTDNFTGVRCRVINNQFARQLTELARNQAEPWEIMQAGVGKIRKAYVEGDTTGGSLAFGQVAGMIQDIPTCSELISGMVNEAESLVVSMQDRLGGAAIRPELQKAG
jgi:enoyl-[acyl-carrier protein] reductase II